MTTPPKSYFVVFHTPGETWQPGVDFREQLGVSDHVAYVSTLANEGKIWSGGPFLDDSGGMMILTVPDAAEAERIAREDPAIASGLLVATVRPWLRVFAPPAANEE